MLDPEQELVDKPANRSETVSAPVDLPTQNAFQSLDFEATKRATLWLLATGAIPSALGAVLIVLTFMAPSLGLGAPALVTGAALSLAMPVAAAVDSALKAKIAIKRMEAEIRATDARLEMTRLEIERSRQATRELR